MLQLLIDSWPFAVATAGTISGIAAFYQKVLQIRELRTKLRRLEEEQARNSVMRVHLPDAEEVKRYSKARIEDHLKRAKFIGTFLSVAIMAGVAASVGTYRYAMAPSIPFSGIAIVRPVENAAVKQGGVVEFRSSLTDLKHYIVVMPLQAPTRWIVDGPITVSRDGAGAGRALFGETTLGVGESFAVGVIATHAQLPDGPLASMPADSQASPYVTVRRTQ